MARTRQVAGRMSLGQLGDMMKQTKRNEALVELRIEKNVPIPRHTYKWQPLVDLLSKMEVGDSVDIGESIPINTARGLSGKQKPKRFVWRGTRVWRRD